MKILFLGGNLAKELAEWLKRQSKSVNYREDKVSINDIEILQPDFIVSYNYKFILNKEIIEFVNRKAINLHISYLPYCKGYYPNVWSFLDDTPKGVTIHYIDEGIDTGDIIVQNNVYIDVEKETLKSSYEILHKAIQKLFKENWDMIKNDYLIPQPQTGGTIHFKNEFCKFEPFIRNKGWDTPIKEFIEDYRKCMSCT